jgi:hypothetical protein
MTWLARSGDAAALTGIPGVRLKLPLAQYLGPIARRECKRESWIRISVCLGSLSFPNLGRLAMSGSVFRSDFLVIYCLLAHHWLKVSKMLANKRTSPFYSSGAASLQVFRRSCNPQ